jgi:hypothetical protein
MPEPVPIEERPLPWLESRMYVWIFDAAYKEHVRALNELEDEELRHNALLLEEPYYFNGHVSEPKSRAERLQKISRAKDEYKKIVEFCAIAKAQLVNSMSNKAAREWSTLFKR